MIGLFTEILIGTPRVVVRARDVRSLSEPEAKWNSKLVLESITAFEQHVGTSVKHPERFTIESGIVAHYDLPPEVAVTTTRERMRFTLSDFQEHGYTRGCPGCIALCRKTGFSRKHSEACRKWMEECLIETAEGRAICEREYA